MFTIDETEHGLRADIRVLGIGGGGGNAIETMQVAGISGVKFIAVNTDAQALAASTVETKIQLGANLTKGLGAGANPEIGRRAAIESYEDIAKSLKGADMAFITAGMGGGTGTGGISVVAEAAKEQGALTVGVVTYPFLFEGRKRRNQAQKGISDLKKYVDTLIIIHNDKLLNLANDKTPLVETFKKTDDILLQAVKGIAELINVKGLINLDFADVKTVMLDKGLALMGAGFGEGETRVIDAVSQAVSSPLLENISIKGATGIIVNVTGSSNLSLMEVNQAISLLTEEADSHAEIIVGAVIDESKRDSLSLTVIATGFDEGTFNLEEEKSERIKWNNGTFSLKKEEKPTPIEASKEAELEHKTDNSKEVNHPIETHAFSSPEKNSDTPNEKKKPDPSENEEALESFESLKPDNKEITARDNETSSLENAPTNPIIEKKSDENQEIQSTSPSPHSSPALAEDSKEKSSIEKEQQSPENKIKKNLTPKEILLSKVKEYREKQQKFFKKRKPAEDDKQILMPFQENSAGEQFTDNDNLLFETEVEISPEDTA